MILISESQYGFRSSQLTADLLTVVSDRFARVFSWSGATRDVTIDIFKTFHRIWHAVLLHKLRSYGISGQTFSLLLFTVIGGFRWFWIGSLRKNFQLILEFFKASFLVLHFSCSYYTLNDLPDHIIWYIIISADDTTLYFKCDQASDLWQQLELASELESDLRYTVNWGRNWLVDFTGKAQLVSLNGSNNTGAIDVKMNGSVLGGKSSFKMYGLTFSSKLDWGFYIISIAITASKKIGALIYSMKFLSPAVALYLYRSTIRPCMMYCCHVWAGVPACYLELLDKLQIRICRTAGPSLAACLESFAHCRNVASLSLLCRCYFDRCSSELAQLVPLFHSGGSSTRYSDRLHDFLSPFLYVTQMSMSTVSFLAQLDPGFLCL